MNIPVILLSYDNRQLTDFRVNRDMSPLERSFLWQGDVRILLAMVKYVEDRWNVAWDTGVAGVPAIIVVEDNVRFYSAFLPVIFTEVVNHTHGLIAEGLNLYQKMIRVRVRPKILLCESYEEAWNYFSTYEEHILGIISDIEFPGDGKLGAAGRCGTGPGGTKGPLGHPDHAAVQPPLRTAISRMPRAHRSCSRVRRCCCTSCGDSCWIISGSGLLFSSCPTAA